MSRLPILAVAALMLLSCIVPAALAAGSDQYYANRIITVVKTPDIAPGLNGRIEVGVFNPFNSTMNSVELRLSIYAYSTTSSETPIGSIPAGSRPHFSDGGKTAYDNFSSLPPSSTAYANFTVFTSQATRHGDFFSTGTYFVSTYISFDIEGVGMRMASKGVFNQSQWDNILVQGSGPAYLNYSYLNGTLGYQGITPDTSFGVNTPSPLFLLWITGGLAVFFAAVSFVLYRSEKRRASK